MIPRHLLSRAMFGSPPRQHPVPRAGDSAAMIDDLLQPGQLALITGPSGAGKSTILRHLRRRLRSRGHAAITVDPARLPSRAPSPRAIDAFDASLPMTLSLLASCGLADAAILERRIHQLSAGQRWRLSLARGMLRMQRSLGHATLLIDEFASMLDPTSAHCLGRTLRRWVVSRPVRAVCIAHDESLMEALAPAVLVVQPLGLPAIVRMKEAA